MWTRRAFTAMFMAGVAASRASLGQGQPSAARAGRRAEVESLRRFAESTHPRGREAAAREDWRQRWDAHAVAAEALSDGDYFVRTRRALGWFKDGHTTVLPFAFAGGVPPALASGPFGVELPIRARLFHDGAWITAAGRNATQLLGTRIGRIGDLDAAALTRAFAQDWPGNDAWAHRWAGDAFSSPALLQALGAVRDASAPLRMVVVDRSGRHIEMTIHPVPAGDDEPRPLERVACEREDWARAAASGNFARVLAEARALYLCIDDMDDVAGKTFEAFTREAFAAMETPGLRRLVVDLRRNGGGNNYLGEPLRKRIARSPFNRPGGLYVLTGPMTFSAAQNLATRLERETFATFVGEPTGGAPNHYGDAAVFKGEATGLVSIVSALAWFDSYPTDSRPWILPDLPVPERYADWQAGRDPALQAALSHEADTTVDELDRERVFYFRRPSQERDWGPFWRTA